MASHTNAARRKLSTTIAPENFAYLGQLVERGRARNVAEAVDIAVERLRRADRRQRLAAETKAYFDNLTSEQAQEENEQAADFIRALEDFDLDAEP